MFKKFIVSKDYQDSRFDRWFKQNISNVPQSLIEKLIRKKKIKINKKKVKTSYRVQLNDVVELYGAGDLKPNNKSKKEKYKPSEKEKSKYGKFIIENNDNFIVINKPSGIPVQAGTKSFKNIIDILRNTKYFEYTKPFVVHRLDKETSGVMIVAKNRKYAQLFTSLFRLRKIQKVYLAIVVGEIEKNKGTLTDTLYHYEGIKKIYTKAVTHFKVLDSNSRYSLLELHPVTGRKHQLRKQLLIRGCPILGDSKYRMHKNYSNKKETLMLHAYKINFSIADTKYSFSADVPTTFKKVLKEKYLKIF